MRFFAEGPDIPNDVLAAADKGEVVFFCGAGISMPGLPSFAQLAFDVASELGADASSRARHLLEMALSDGPAETRPSFDNVFSAFQHEYGLAQVETAVRKRLKVKAAHAQHQTILRISRNAAGAPRVVTTNFDRLFEAADGSLEHHQPPALPLIAEGQDWNGIVYLHGRAAENAQSTNVQGLVLGVGDFGRAYLTQAWATRFMRELIARYIVVLVGYSADDPPIQYLLQGLESHSTQNERRLYAFADSSVEHVVERWRQRGGVQAIPYDRGDAQHSGLWKSLRAWGLRVNDPIQWRRRIVTTAGRGPRRLKSFQRGQVVEVVCSVEGARDFANANPPPPAEWLFVFDAHARYAKLIRHRQKTFDPLAIYGLDADPPRPPKARPYEQQAPPGVDVLQPHPTRDEAVIAPLAGFAAHKPSGLSPRLFQLSVWIGRICDQPAALWWAAGKYGLHPRLRNAIEHRLEYTKPATPALIARAWRLVFEAEDNGIEGYTYGWYQIERRLSREGWTAFSMRAVADLVRPRLTVKRGDYLARPPPSVTGKSKLAHFIECSIQFVSPPTQQMDPPREFLPDLIAALRRGLLHAAALHQDCDLLFDRTPTLYPEPNRPGEPHYLEDGQYFLWFARLFEKLREHAPHLARAEMCAWPRYEHNYFDKLRLWASSKPDLATADELVDWLLSLPQESFWQSERRRELLWLLRSRWTALTDEQRHGLERRILAGPDRWRRETQANFVARRATESAVVLGWLRNHVCTLSPDAEAALTDLIAVDARWRDAWIDSADESLDSRGGAVHIDDDPGVLLGIPLGQVIAKAAEIAGGQRQALLDVEPFDGLVRTAPQRAMMALIVELREGKHAATPYWQALLSRWPEATPRRATLLLARTLTRLDDRTLVQLRWYVCDWLKDHAIALFATHETLAWALWDRIFSALENGGSTNTQSSVSEMIFDDRVPQSRRTYEHALNSPIGKLVETLFIRLRVLKLDEGAGLPAPIKARMERALAAAGEGADHAAAKLLHFLYWMEDLDPSWAEARLLPLLDLNNPLAEPAWSGFLSRRTLPDAALFRKLKQPFLTAFAEAAQHHWSEAASRLLVQFLIAMLADPKHDTRISFADARAALKIGTAEQREAALSALEVHVEKGEWSSFGKPFLENAWPRERALQSGSTSRLMVSIAKASGQSYPEAVSVVAPFLCAAQDLDLTTHGLTDSGAIDGLSFAQRWPQQTLQLLDSLIAGNAAPPFGLEQLLQQTAEADASVRTTAAWRRLNTLLARR
jgi:hypothetical protein